VQFNGAGADWQNHTRSTYLLVLLRRTASVEETSPTYLGLANSYSTVEESDRQTLHPERFFGFLLNQGRLQLQTTITRSSGSALSRQEIRWASPYPPQNLPGITSTHSQDAYVQLPFWRLQAFAALWWKCKIFNLVRASLRTFLNLTL